MRLITMTAALSLLALPLAPTPALAQGAPEEAEQAAPQAPPPPDPRVVRALKLRFEQEPAVAAVQKAALKFFKVHPAKVASFRRGAAWKALMPDVEFIFNREDGTSDRTLWDRLYPTFVDYKDLEKGSRSTTSYGIRAHWSLDRLIFNAESLDVASLVGVQEGLLREITSLYFTRRRLMTAINLNPPQDPNEQITEELRLQEITANLDALTGGWFSKEMRKRFEDKQ
jgi:hypothetical protein